MGNLARLGMVSVGLVVACAVGAQPARAQCAGDCNGNGVVSINELISGVNIALGNAAVSTCEAADVNGNGAVTINELIAAVNSALNGCPATPTVVPDTPTPPATVTVTEAPTDTPPASTATATATAVATATATASGTATAVDTGTPTATAIATPTASPSAVSTATPSEAVTQTATATAVDTATPGTPGATSTASATGTPSSNPTDTATPASTDTVAAATATPTPTQTTAVTPTFTVTPIPQNTCGNGFLEVGEACSLCPGGTPATPCCDVGETCSACAADCQVQACTPSAPTVAFAVDLVAPLGFAPTTTTVLVGYDSAAMSIPGSGGVSSVRQRVVAPPPLPQSFAPNDLDYAVRVLVSRNTPVAQIATITFDQCTGQQAPTLADLACAVETCSQGGSPVPGCTCTIRLP